MTTEEMRRASAGYSHAYRPSFKRTACSRCGREREHPSHSASVPPLACPCGAALERPEVHAHLRSHGLWVCGLDPWRMTDRSLAELVAFAQRLARTPDSENENGAAARPQEGSGQE
jgi:hypothetical protein